jgi:hypothetical protein
MRGWAEERAAGTTDSTRELLHENSNKEKSNIFTTFKSSQ